MPLHSHSTVADIFIHELLQPHRYGYALNCKCGFQASGFAAHEDKNDPVADMKGMAFAHLSQKHKINATEAVECIHVMETKTVGGYGYDQLLPLWQAEQEKEKSKETKAPTVAAQIAELKKTAPPAVAIPPIVK